MPERRERKSSPPKGTPKRQPLSAVGRATVDLHRNLEANVKGHINRHKNEAPALGIAAVVIGRLLGQVLSALQPEAQWSVRQTAMEACDDQIKSGPVKAEAPEVLDGSLEGRQRKSCPYNDAVRQGFGGPSRADLRGAKARRARRVSWRSSTGS